MERIIKTAQKFRAKIAVCVNKYDTNLNNTKKIGKYCSDVKLPYIGSIPFDRQAVMAVNKGLSIADIDCEAGKAVSEIFNNTMKLLYSEVNL